MPITTGSYPKGLGGGKATAQEDNMEMQGGSDETAYGTTMKKGGSGDKGFLGAQEKGYSPRKAMAAGMLDAGG